MIERLPSSQFSEQTRQMKPWSLLLAVILSSCAGIRETAIVHAPQGRVREAIAEEILHKGGMITDDTKFTVTADYPQTNPLMEALVGVQFQEWVFNLSGSDPTRVVVKPWDVKDFRRVEVMQMDSKALGIVQETLANIKRKAEGTSTRFDPPH